MSRKERTRLARKQKALRKTKSRKTLAAILDALDKNELEKAEGLANDYLTRYPGQVWGRRFTGGVQAWKDEVLPRLGEQKKKTSPARKSCLKLFRKTLLTTDIPNGATLLRALEPALPAGK